MPELLIGRKGGEAGSDLRTIERQAGFVPGRPGRAIAKSRRVAGGLELDFYGGAVAAPDSRVEGVKRDPVGSEYDDYRHLAHTIDEHAIPLEFVPVEGAGGRFLVG